MAASSSPPIHFPRIAIEFCVQCKWNLRAAYFAQELLQTFATSIGEISLIPVTGGVFTITLYHRDTPEPKSQTQTETGTDNEAVIPLTEASQDSLSITTSVIWDRKRDGGFPETKELKNRVRNIIEPGKDMGHVDRALRKGKEGSVEKQGSSADGQGKAGEVSTGDKTGQSNSQVSTGKPMQGKAENVGKSTEHADHKDGKSPPDDCEECKEAMKDEGRH